MPVESLLVKLKESGYAGNFIVKVQPKELGAGDAETVGKRLTEAKEFLEKYFT